MRQLNVGVSISVTKGSNIWANGINQNIALLVQLLRLSPVVSKVWLLNGGDSEELPPDMSFDGIDVPLVRPQEVTHEIDVVIEMGAILPSEWMAHVHALGTKIVGFGVGHNYVSLNESIIFDRPGGMYLSDPAIRSETWGLRQHSKTCSPMLQTMTRGPVYDMPHLWSPYFLQKKIKSLDPSGPAFGFQPTLPHQGPAGWRIGIFEPNISVGKNCVIPMLVCEQAHRLDPSSVSRMMVMCSFHMKEHPTFNRFALNLDLTRNGMASYEPRLQFSDCMVTHRLDAVVTHHWEWGQNYLYYDALYGGYPLIHNSEFLREDGLGFYYPEFSARHGGEVLLEAWKQPAEYWQDYRNKASDFLKTLSPDHPENIWIFSERLIHLTGKRP